MKTFEKTFENAKIELISFQSEIESFARKQFMSNRRNMTLQLIFEELIYELLFNRRADIFPFEMKMLYNEILEKCAMALT